MKRLLSSPRLRVDDELKRIASIFERKMPLKKAGIRKCKCH